MRPALSLCYVVLTAWVLVLGVGRAPVWADPPAVKVEQTGGFGGGARENRDVVPWDAPNVYVLDKVTSPSFRTWLLLKQTINVDFPPKTPLRDALKRIKAATAGKDSKGLSIYVDPIQLMEAEATMESPVVLQLEGLTVAKALHLALAQLGLMFEVRDDGLVVVLCEGCNAGAPKHADEWITDEVQQLRGAVSALRAEIDRAIPSPAVPRPANAQGQAMPLRRVSQPQEDGDPDDANHVGQFQVLRRLNAAGAKTWLKLAKPIDFKAKDTPLDAALARFKDATKNDDGSVQIYVNPLGLHEAEKTIDAEVDIEVEGAPASSVLELMLKQLGLKFFVDPDGLIVVTAESDDWESLESRDLTTLNTLVALQREVQTLRREMALLRRHRRATATAGRDVLPASVRGGP